MPYFENFLDRLNADHYRTMEEHGIYKPPDVEVGNWREEDTDLNLVKYRRIVYQGPVPGSYGFILTITDEQMRALDDSRLQEIDRLSNIFLDACPLKPEFDSYIRVNLDQLESRCQSISNKTK